MGMGGIGKAIGTTAGEVADAAGEAANVVGNAISSAAQPLSEAATALADEARQSVSALRDRVRDQFGEFQSQVLDTYRTSGFQASLEALREGMDRLAAQLDKSLTWTREQVAEQARWAHDAAIHPAVHVAMKAADWTYDHVLDPAAPAVKAAAQEPRDWLSENAARPPIDLATEALWLGNVPTQAAAWTYESLNPTAVGAAADADWYEHTQAAARNRREQAPDETGAPVVL